MRSGCEDPHFLDLGISWRWVVSFTPQPLYPQGKIPGTHWIGGWVDPRAGMDDVKKRKFLTLLEHELRSLGCPACRCTDYAIPAQTLPPSVGRLSGENVGDSTSSIILDLNKFSSTVLHLIRSRCCCVKLFKGTDIKYCFCNFWKVKPFFRIFEGFLKGEQTCRMM
jgi:hypothetical protein